MAEINNESWQSLFARLQAGEDKARQELISRTYSRLYQLMARMLQTFPSVQERATTSDVLHDSLVRLWQALGKVHVLTLEDYLRFAAVHMRRQLLDMVRQIRRQPKTMRFDKEGKDSDTDPPHRFDPVDTDVGLLSLEEWCEFHQFVDRLPVEERSVFDLLFYHGLSQAEAAQILNISVPTVKRRWAEARIRLREYLDDLGR
jgi:RNA polymerase sigma-70 factor (ECF subfamily)